MDKILAIRKAPGIEDIVKAHATLDTNEKKKKVNVEGSLLFKGFESLFKQYEQYLETKIDISKPFKHIDKLPVLSPEQANAFLQATIGYEAHKNYAWNTGLFMSAILKKSYNAGHCNFKFTTRTLAHKINSFGSHLIANEKKPIEIIIDGSIGDGCGASGRNTIVYAENIGDFCGYSGENIKVHAKSIGDWCGNLAENITAYAESMGNDCGWYGNKITVHAENFGKDCGLHAKDSTFKTANRKTLRQLKREVKRKARNKIYFIKPNGKEKRIWIRF